MSPAAMRSLTVVTLGHVTFLANRRVGLLYYFDKTLERRCWSAQSAYERLAEEVVESETPRPGAPDYPAPK
jgi:hypothetical protein